MDAVALTVGSAWTLAGLLIMGLAIPLVRGRVSPNGVYGVRLSQSFRSADAWYAINRYGGRRLIIWAVPLIVVGLISFFLPLQSRPALALVLGIAPLIFVLIPAWESWRFARRYEAPSDRQWP